MDWKLEVVPVPVSDVDRAKRFYSEQVGFVVDLDTELAGGARLVQLTPPGSGCSIHLNTGLSKVPPGLLEGLQLVVDDIDAVREALAGRGVAVGDVQQLGPEGAPGSRFCFFEDPDGNGWAVQELKRP